RIRCVPWPVLVAPRHGADGTRSRTARPLYLVSDHGLLREATTTSPQTENVVDHVVGLLVRQYDVGHHAMRRVEERAQGQGTHPGRIRDGLERRRLRVGREPAPALDCVALRASLTQRKAALRRGELHRTGS